MTKQKWYDTTTWGAKRISGVMFWVVVLLTCSSGFKHQWVGVVTGVLALFYWSWSYTARFHTKPDAYRVKDYADGWILFSSKKKAEHEAEVMGGALVEPLFAGEGEVYGAGEVEAYGGRS